MKIFIARAGLLAVAGAAWGVIIGWLAAACLTLFSGTALVPDGAAYALAGAAGGVFAAGRARRTRAGPLVAFLGVALVLALARGAFFDRPLPVWRAGELLVFAAAHAWAMSAAAAPLADGQWNRRRAELCIVAALRGIGFVVFAVLVVAPFYVLVMTSFTSQQALLANPLNLIPDFSRGLGELFRAYLELFRDFNFGRYMLVSAVVSIATVIVTLLFAAPGAYAVARLRFAGRAVATRALLLVYLVPAIVLVIPLYAVFSRLGLRDTLLGLVVVYPATTLPVAIYMLQGYFRGVPAELEDAAQMDGCSRLGLIARVTLPLSAPALASVGLYVFMIAWNEFLFAFMFLDDPDIFTLSRGVVALNSSEIPRQHLMAGAVVSTLPVLAAFLWAERFLVGGLAAGGVKG